MKIEESFVYNNMVDIRTENTKSPVVSVANQI